MDHVTKAVCVIGVLSKVFEYVIHHLDKRFLQT
jgi:hypothetical protein